MQGMRQSSHEAYFKSMSNDEERSITPQVGIFQQPAETRRAYIIVRPGVKDLLLLYRETQFQKRSALKL
jgi:hypothetical protein